MVAPAVVYFVEFDKAFVVVCRCEQQAHNETLLDVVVAGREVAAGRSDRAAPVRHLARSTSRPGKCDDCAWQCVRARMLR